MCRTHLMLALVFLYVGMAQSWDIAVSVGARLEFYTDDTKTDTVHFKSRNLTAITYDEVHNMMLFVDKQSDSDAICGYHLDSTDTRCFIKRIGSDIQDLAFDPATELLFFTDTKDGSINWISLKDHRSQDNVYGNLLIKLNMDDQTVKNIAVDSCRGYIYWTNTYIYTGVNMERARFDGSEREVIYNYLPIYSFAIDPQTHSNYLFFGVEWLQSSYYGKVDVRKKYLKGENTEQVSIDYNDEALYFYVPKDLTVSNNYVYWMNSSGSESIILQISKKPTNPVKPGDIIRFYGERPLGIAANYRIKDQVQGLQDCEALSSLFISTTTATDKFENIEQTKHKQQAAETCQTTKAKQPKELNCVHGLPVCKCIPGYTGERCNVSVCENYCMQGYCSFNNEGIPKCRCNVGYFGERCEVNTCNGYCLNDGNCSLNEKSEPVCQCKRNYGGDRCEVSGCLNYCLQGSCSFNDESNPECRCNAGYSGERCEVNACRGYCLNNGVCMLSEEDEPVCECVGNYEGTRCESLKNDFVCSQQIKILQDLFSN